MWRRISGVMLRHLYLYRRNPARAGEIVFWPVMDLLTWGFLTAYLERLVMPTAVSYLLGAMIFWDVLYRSQQAITLSLSEEIWMRNLLNLFITPLRLSELLLALGGLGVLRTVASTAFLGLLASLLYAFDLLTMGWAVLPFFANLLLFGWAVGLGTMALVLRFGRAAEALVWGIPFLLQPVSAVYYPLDVLPGWLQTLASGLPSTYVFEGMRTALHTGRLDTRGVATALLLNLLYLAAGTAVFGWVIQLARRQGYLSRVGLQ